MASSSKKIYLCVPVYIYQIHAKKNVDIEFENLGAATKMAKRIQRINRLDQVDYESRCNWLKEYLGSYISDGFAVRDDSDASITIRVETVQTEQVGDFPLYWARR